MAKNIRWQVTFKSLNGTTYYVNIYDNDWPAGVVMPVRGATDPFYFEEDNSDDLLNSVLRYRTGYIRIVEDSFGTLNDIYPSSMFDRYVECVTGNTVVFNGYIQVQDFQRPLKPGPRELELPVISPLGLFNECTFNPVTPPTTTTLGALLDMTLGVGTYTKVVFPVITGEELSKTIFSLVVSPWDEDFHHSKTVGAYFKVMKPQTYAYLVEGICKAFGWICHDTPEALVFTSFDHLGVYNSYPKGHIGEQGSRQSESVSQSEEPISSHFTPADADATMHNLLPDTGVEVGYEGELGRVPFDLSRTLYQNVITYPGMSADDGEMWSLCNLLPIDGLYEVVGVNGAAFDSSGNVDYGEHCVAWNGHIGILCSMMETYTDGEQLFEIRFYTKKRTGDRWAVSFKGMTSNDGNGGYVTTIGSMKDDEKVTDYYIKPVSTVYDDYVKVVFVYHYSDVAGSLYPHLPAHALIFIYDIHFEYIENEELYAEYRFAPAEESDILPSNASHPPVSSSVTMPFSMYRLNDHMIGDTLLATKITEYPYLFQPRTEMYGTFRATGVPYLYHAMMWGYLNKKWRMIAMDFHPWDDEYRLTMQSSPVLDGGSVPTYTIIATALHTSLSGYNETVDEGEAFTHQLTADTGYELGSVTVLMGNEDITSTAYNSSTGYISIASVTGNVSILVTTEQWVDQTWDTKHVYSGTSVNSSLTYGTSSNYDCMKVPCQEGDVFKITGHGASSYRLYSWLNTQEVVIQIAASNTTKTDFEVTAPVTAAYLVVNAHRNYTRTVKKKTT
jgi:hypothetical protein